VRGAEETANHKKRKNKGTKRPGRTNPAHGFIPARKGTFLFAEKYSLDRGPLMGTNLWSEAKLSIGDYGKKYCITMALTITPTDFANVLSINGIKYQT